MTPEYKLHVYITTITVSSMYFIIKYIIPNINDITVASYTLSLEFIITALTTGGIYVSLSHVLLKYSRNINWFKKHLLGARYLNGTWIGKFTVAKDETILTVEKFEQTLSTLKIKGYAFDSKGKTYAQWESVAESIQEVSGALTYTYTCTRNDDVFSFEGIGVFKFDRVDIHLPPTHLHGYSADLTDGIRNENREKKVSDRLLPVDEALKLAKKEYLEDIE